MVDLPKGDYFELDEFLSKLRIKISKKEEREHLNLS